MDTEIHPSASPTFLGLACLPWLMVCVYSLLIFPAPWLLVGVVSSMVGVLFSAHCARPLCGLRFNPESARLSVCKKTQAYVSADAILEARVAAICCLLVLRVGGKRRQILVFPDAVSAAQYRDLKIWILRFGREENPQGSGVGF